MGREEYESGKFTTMNIMAGYFQEQPPLYPKIKSSNLVKVEVTEKGHSYGMDEKERITVTLIYTEGNDKEEKILRSISGNKNPQARTDM